MASTNGWPVISRSNWGTVDDAEIPLGVDDYIVVRQWDPDEQSFVPRKIAAKTLLSQMSSAGIKDIVKGQVQVSPGLVGVAGKNIDVAVQYSKTTDLIITNGFAGGLTLGTILTDAQIITDGTMRLTFGTTIALGLTLGPVTLKYTRLVF